MSFSFKSNKKKVLSALNMREEQALEEIGELIKKEAVRNAPVHTGKYKDSIDYKIDKSGKRVGLGSDDFRTLFLEKGTTKMPKKAHLSPAVESNKGPIKGIVEKVLRKL